MFSSFESWLFFVSALAGLASFWLIAYRTGYKRGREIYKGSQDIKTEQLRMSKVYAPLRKLLIDTHLSSCRSVLYPYFRIRLKRAYHLLKQRAFKQSFKALFDKGVSKQLSGVEFGCFPSESIEKIIKDNFLWCDSELVSLLQSALRAKYESRYEGDEILSYEDIKLIDHICDEYYRLNKKLISKKPKE